MPEGFTPLPYGGACNPCLNGKHDNCKTDIYNPSTKRREQCNCQLRTMVEHP